MWLFAHTRFIGRENIPEGACVVCGNHTSNVDPFFLLDMLPISDHLRILTKVELYRIPVVGAFLRSVGMIRVDRSIADITPVRESMAHLKIGGKVAIFPQGTRVTEDESVAAKTGAVRIADKTRAPILPVYIPRRKRIFRRNTVVIGVPYEVNPAHVRLTPEDTERLSAELMGRIAELAP
jgi:1-acyl-sn-glycerol-3-phosphate acyltransferase